jgi:hypothetical protein
VKFCALVVRTKWQLYAAVESRSCWRFQTWYRTPSVSYFLLQWEKVALLHKRNISLLLHWIEVFLHFTSSSLKQQGSLSREWRRTEATMDDSAWSWTPARCISHCSHNAWHGVAKLANGIVMLLTLLRAAMQTACIKEWNSIPIWSLSNKAYLAVHSQMILTLIQPIISLFSWVSRWPILLHLPLHTVLGLYFDTLANMMVGSFSSWILRIKRTEPLSTTIRVRFFLQRRSLRHSLQQPPDARTAWQRVKQPK